MGGLGAVLDIAKGALLTQKYAIDVVGHNIANVNTPGYTRQVALLEAKDAQRLGGIMLGRGVEITDVVQLSNDFIDTTLRDRRSDLAAMEEKEVYLSVLEGIFNEQTGLPLSAQLADFWNAWHDLSSDPAGTDERNILYERGLLLAQSFNDLAYDLNRLEREINISLEAGAARINELLDQIATLSVQIIDVGVTGNANDLRDQRNTLLNELSQYLDIVAMEDEDGNVSVSTRKGHILVSKADTYHLSLKSGDIEWQGSGGTQVVVTDTITGGKMGGWLDMRDGILPQVGADLDELAKSIVREVNQIHAQGVGTQAFSSVTGTNAAADSTEEMGTVDSGLDFYDEISDGSFELWLYDGTGAVVGSTTINIVKNTTTLEALAASITAIHANMTASVSGGKLQITAAGNYRFAFGDDTSGVLAGLGINSFFSGSDASGMGVNPLLGSTKEFIAAARIDPATGAFTDGDNANALALANLQYQDVTVKQWSYSRGSTPTSQDASATLENHLQSFVGSIGIESQSVQRAREYNEIIVNELNQTRDSISGVSLDEELTNLIEYQHAYAAAAKLITTADEMLQVLMDLR
jgi:flagellar hook-associated protein 1 FlgK